MFLAGEYDDDDLGLPEEEISPSDDKGTRPRQAFFLWQSSAWIEQEHPRIGWHVEGVVQLRGITTLYGLSGTMKSFLAQVIAAAVSRGVTVFGRAVLQSPVLYIAAEGVDGLGVRLRGYRQHEGLNEPLPSPLQWVGRRIRIFDPKEISKLIRDIRTARDVFCGGDSRVTLLVIIDTLAACLGGDGDENLSSVMEKVMDHLRRVAEENVSILLLHHMDKRGQSERGHGSLRASSEVMIRATLKSPGVSLTFTKRRDGVTGDVLRLAIHQVQLPDGEATCTLGLASDPRNTKGLRFPTVESSATENCKRAIESLRLFGATGARSMEWQDSSRLSDGTYNRCRRELLAKNTVIKAGGKYILAECLKES